MATILTKQLPTNIFTLLKKVDYTSIPSNKLNDLKNRLYSFESHFPKINVVNQAVNYKTLDFPEWLQNFINNVDWNSISKFQLALVETFLKNEVVALPKLK